MTRTLDMKGKKFERLTVLSFVSVDRYGLAKWLCRCDCGGSIVTVGKSLRAGLTRSCGCLRNENLDRIRKGRK